jgi:hypothetical protein
VVSDDPPVVKLIYTAWCESYLYSAFPYLMVARRACTGINTGIRAKFFSASRSVFIGLVPVGTHL